MKSCVKVLMASASAALLAACGGDSGSNSKSDAEDVLQAETFEDLPNCSKNRDGDIMEVLDERVAYICDDGRWEYDHDILDSVKTEDKLPNCTKNREGDMAYVVEDEAAVRCNDGKWKEIESEEDSKANSSSSKKDSDGKSSGKSSDDDSSDSGDGKSSANSSSSNGDEKSTEGSSDSKESGEPEKSSDSKAAVETTDTERDSRDGHVYKTVKIGNQWWFAENLNYDDGYGVCPMKEESNCDTYGRLYSFQKGSENSSKAYTVCPSGWHVPDSLDWNELISYVSKNNGDEAVGVSLKARKGWYEEGDTVLIEAEDPFARDTARVASTAGTDRFGFRALPAGSCWNSGECYVGDDTRFAISSTKEFNGGYKLAFDKDELMFDEDASFGFISVRCLKNPKIDVDPIKSVVVVGTQLWMAENLTHDGSEEFDEHEAYYACPDGWRLPSQEEFEAVFAERIKSRSFTDMFTDGTWHFYTLEKGVYSIELRNCSTPDKCSFGYYGSGSNKPQLVRCVREKKVEKIEESKLSSLSCEASEVDLSDSTANWTISGCGSDCELTWDFGANSAGVKISGTTATKKFTTVGRATPTVKAFIKNSMVVDGEEYGATRYMTCPAVFASMGTLIFSSGINDKVPLIGGVKYAAALETPCGDYGGSAQLECSIEFDGKGKKSIEVESSVNTIVYEAEFAITENISALVCDGKQFALTPSADMKCSISYY